MVEHALKLPVMGHKYFPLAARSKVPQVGTSGFKDASSDSEVIRRVWEKDPNAPIGLATAAMSGACFVDIDRKVDQS